MPDTLLFLVLAAAGILWLVGGIMCLDGGFFDRVHRRAVVFILPSIVLPIVAWLAIAFITYPELRAVETRVLPVQHGDSVQFVVLPDGEVINLNEEFHRCFTLDDKIKYEKLSMFRLGIYCVREKNYRLSVVDD